jgi:hypothetical protein
MVYYNLDYGVFGLCPSSDILRNTQHFENWIQFLKRVFLRISDDGQSPKTQWSRVGITSDFAKRWENKYVVNHLDGLL